MILRMKTCTNCGKPLILKGGKCVYCGAEPIAKPPSIEQRKIYLVDYSIDIVFCIDYTASMAPILDSIKENIIRFIDVCNESSLDWRARVVLFRDSAVDEEWLVNNKPFVSNKDELVTQLGSAMAKGKIEDETDYSSLMDALYYAAEESEWRAIRFPGGPMDSDVEEFMASGGRYGFKFIVGFTDSNTRPFSSKVIEEIEMIEQRKRHRRFRTATLPNHFSYNYDHVLLFAHKGAIPKTDSYFWVLKDFDDPIEFYYHKELDFSPIYSVLSRMYT